ncbi:hypothetical protein DSAG12_00324 [Promethearchaeum syntrophicum]|uniref:Uncharacterized protein n=1 Tax=Promethearchaeum syntrophicum TaxID=2594042 RepID=A0A5B9D6D9_9ARCH|nr:hypothetical protein [Candidatus Prometheoarchaeum syntrophicum]
MNKIILISISGILYILFLIWYKGFRKPLSPSETENIIEEIKRTSNITSERENHLFNAFREITTQDDGKEFLMVNLMKFRDNNPESEAMKAHKKYSRQVMPELLKRGSFPIFMSKIIGKFIYNDKSITWDQIAIIRYRSKRDFLNMAKNLANKDGGKNKWLALENTEVFPSKRVIVLGSIPFVLGLIIFMINLLFIVIS